MRQVKGEEAGLVCVGEGGRGKMSKQSALGITTDFNHHP